MKSFLFRQFCHLGVYFMSFHSYLCHLTDLISKTDFYRSYKKIEKQKGMQFPASLGIIRISFLL